jgi:hypothetical protein
MRHDGPLSALMSAVNTGIPAWDAFSMAGPIPLEFTGHTMIAATFWTMKFSICPRCFAKSQSPEVIKKVVAFLLGRFLQTAFEIPIKDVSLVNNVTPMTLCHFLAASSRQFQESRLGRRMHKASKLFSLAKFS